MANKTKFETDDFNFDSSLDFEMPDFNGGSVKDNRSATTKVATSAIEGFKNTATSTSFIKNIVRKSLPKGYGDAMDFTDQTTATIKGAFSDAAKEVKPVINDIKRTTGKILPSVESKLPKNVAKKIKEWTTNTATSSPSAEEQQESALQMQLGEIFKFQTNQALQKDNDDKARDVLRDSIEHSRHMDTVTQLNGMRISLQQLANYQKTIESAYQKKSLELQFRSYFLAQQSLVEFKKHAEISRLNLEGILKNTGLPEFVKLKNSERLKEAMRNRFIDTVNDSIIGKRNEFIRTVAGKLGSKLKDKARDFAGNVRMGIDAADQMHELNQMKKEMGGGGSAAESIADIGGGMAADALGNRIGKYIRGKIPKDSKVYRYGNKLTYGVQNAPQILTDWANQDQFNRPDRKGLLGKAVGMLDSGSPLGMIGDAIRESIKATNVVDNKLSSDKVSNLEEPTHFSRGASKAVTEVIPGYLARIYRELQVMRTGNDNIELTMYDFNGNRFADKSKLAKKIFEDISGRALNSGVDNSLEIAKLKSKKKLTDEEKQRLSYLEESKRVGSVNFTSKQISDLIDEVDTDKKLSEAQRKELSKKMLSDNLRNRSGGAERLSDVNTYRGKNAHAFANAFKNYFSTDTSGEKQVQFASKFSRLGDTIRDQRRNIQDYVNAGNRDILEEMGILNEDGDSINMEKLYAYQLGDDFTPSRRRRKVHRANGGPIYEPDPRRRGMGGDTVDAKLMHGEYVLPADTVRAVGVHNLDNLRNSTHKQIHLANGGKVGNGKTTGLNLLQSINDTLIRIEGKIGRPLGDVADGVIAKGKGLFDKGLAYGQDIYAHKDEHIANLKGRFNDVSENARYQATLLKHEGRKHWGNRAQYKKQVEEFLKDKKAHFDIWVEGEAKPRITAAGIKAREYYDKTSGQVIEKYEDIRGDVVDKYGQLVLRIDEAKKAFINSPEGKLALEKYASIKGSIKKGIADAKPMFGKMAGWFKNKATGIADNLTGAHTKFNLKDDVLTQISKTLLRIEHRLNKGIPIGGKGESGKKSGFFWNRSVGDVVGDTMHMGMRGIEKLQGGLRFLTRGAWKTGQEAYGLGKDLGSYAGGRILDRMKGIKDVYVKGDPKPRLLYRKIKNGDYRSLKSGRIITRFKDINGAVVDENGNIVIAEDEVKDAYIKDGLAKKAISAFGAVTDTAKRFLGGITGNFGSFISIARDLGTMAAKKLWSLTKLPQDVYTKDKPSVPTLLAKTMKAGGYFSRITGRVISHPGEIDGPVLDDKGNEVLTAEEFAKGLYDIHGRPIKTGMGKVFHILGGGLRTGMKIANTAAGALKGLAKGFIDTATGLVKHGLGGIHIGFGGGKHSKTAVELLTEIRDILKDRLVKPKKIREGSYEDQIADQKEAAKQKMEEAILKSNGEKAGMFTGLSSKLAGLFGKKKDAEKKDEDDDGKSLKDMAEQSLMDRFLGGGKGLMSKGKSLLKFAGKGLGIAGAAYGGYQAYQAAKEGNYGEAALDGTLAAASGIAGIGGVSALGTVGSGLLAGAAGLASLLASPVVLGGAAVAAVGYLGYKYLTKKKLDQFSKIRYVQYGYLVSDEDHVNPILSIEDIMLKAVSFDDGIAKLDERKIDVKALLDILGLDLKSDKEGLRNYLAWFDKRFKPVFLTHMTALKKIAPGKSLSDLEKLPIDIKLKFIDLVKWPDGPYNFNISPFKGEKELLATKTHVDTVVQNTIDELNKEYDDKKQKGATAADLEKKKANTTANKIEKQSSFWSDVKDSAAVGVNTALQNAKDIANKAADYSKKAVTAGVTLAAGKALTARNTLLDVKDSIGVGIKTAAGGAVTAAGNVMKGIKEGVGGLIDSIPMPTAEGSWNALKGTIGAAASAVGVDEKLMAVMAAIESGFRTSVKAATSSATGLYQFITSTWKNLVKKYGPKYGISPDTPPTDPRANALMGAEYIKENANALKSLNRPISDTDIYLAHFLGPAGAKKLLSSDANLIAANIMPDQARANATIFYNKDGSPRTVGQVYAEINRRVRSKGKQFGIDTVDGKAPEAKPTTDKIPNAAKAGAAAGGVVKASVNTNAPTAKDFSLPPEVAHAASGFSHSNKRDVAVQQHHKQEMNREELSKVQGILNESLEVQKEQLKTLKAVLAVINKDGKNKADDVKEERIKPLPPQPSKKENSPVSMRKSYT